MNKSTKVKLLKKPLKDALRSSLYLDFYPSLINPQTGKSTRREFLDMWVWNNPKSKAEREHNSQYNALSLKVLTDRQHEIDNHRFGFLIKKPIDKDFLRFFDKYVDELPIGSNKRIYTAVLTHLTTYSKSVMYSQIKGGFCEGFRKYLLDKVAQNTAHSYFFKFKGLVNQLVKKKELQPVEFQTIKLLDTQRHYLTSSEIEKLKQTDCKKPIYKNACLFAVMTGLRFSDVEKLTWGEVKPTDKGTQLEFRMQKTKSIQVVPLNDAALSFCGERCNDAKKVFAGIHKGDNTTLLPKWCKLAGIEKDITFHCFRHTHATLMLNSGIDIYTVSKMLGHKDLKTTEIYAKLSDKRLRDAVNIINI